MSTRLLSNAELGCERRRPSNGSGIASIVRAGIECSFAADKGPTVCGHRVWYRQDQLEGALLAKFREAMTPPIINALTQAVNAELGAASRAHDDRARELKTEILRLEREAGNLVRFLAGGESFSVRSELQSIEAGLQGLRLELTENEHEAGLNLASVAWLDSSAPRTSRRLAARRRPPRAA